MIKFIFLLLYISLIYGCEGLMIESIQKEGVIKNTAIGFLNTFQEMIWINYTFAKAYAPYNTSIKSIQNSVGDIARIQFRWIYR